MSHFKSIFLALTCVGFFATPMLSIATPVGTSDIVVVEFSIPGPPPPSQLGPVDMLSISLNRGLSSVPGIDATVWLFDGDTLLGTFRIVNGWGDALFRDASSSLRLFDPTVIDFTTILDGSIDGRFEYQITRFPQIWTLEPGDVVVVEFEFTEAPPPPPSGPVDTLGLTPLADFSQFGPFDATVRLYDGNTLLGTYQVIDNIEAWFRTGASVFRFGDPTVIDFSTIVDGSIDGRFEYEVTRLPNDASSAEVDLYGTFLSLGRALSANGYEGLAYGDPRITNAYISGKDGVLNPLLTVDLDLSEAIIELATAMGTNGWASIPFNNQPQVTDAYLKPTTFGDVPRDHWAYSFIEILGQSGITAGCGAGNYCPDNAVTRAQMAVFLERGIHGSDFAPPAATGNVFLDVGANDFAASFIEQLYSDGITAGCGNNNFCPDNEVTRAQMAVFLLRAKHGPGYGPPTATGVFGDVPMGHWAVHWIEQLAAEGITAGCGSGNYCPDAPVTRAQMAVFLVRTFGL